jgi:hypothetical protein
MDEFQTIEFTTNDVARVENLLFETSLSGHQQLARALLVAGIGFLVSKGVAHAFNDSVKAIRSRKGL